MSRINTPRARQPAHLPTVAPRLERRIGFAALLALLALASGCAEDPNFAERPGFDEYFSEHPPMPRAANRAERELLERYRPQLRVPGSASGPIDFYRDYIAHGTLEANGQRWSEVDRDLLAAHVEDPEAVFRHQPPRQPDPQPTAYGRVHYRELEPFGELTFLQWHFVFRFSGLPFELPLLQEAAAQMVAKPRDWHQLDHYTAATLVLGPNGTPLGAVLQQHNYLRAYWFGRDLSAPPDGRLQLAAALRSNELYPWHGEQRRHRAVRFLEADNVEWLATGAGEAPWSSSHDITVAGEPVDYALEYLRETDPFYRFHGHLGERRRLPGRDGPPGADYNTLPAFQDPLLQFCAFRWPEPGERERLSALQTLLATPSNERVREQLMNDCRRFVAKSIGYNASDLDDGYAR